MSENSQDDLLADLGKQGQNQDYAEQNKIYAERAKKLGTDKIEEGDGVSYDNMDYGDEFNDDEEERYANETYGKKKNSAKKGKDENSGNEEEGEEDGEEESEESAEEIVPLAKTFSKRENRGQRMTALVGKA